MSQWGLHQQYAFSEGVVRYGIEGQGPDIVLVHGTPWSSYTWHLLVPVLAEHFRVHFYDFVGYGQSEMRAGQDVSLAIQSRLLAQLLHHWDVHNPGVVAHDFGGATVLRAHLLHGCDFSRLLLIDVVALAPWGSAFFKHIQEHEAAFAGVPGYIHQAIVETYIRGALHQDLPSAQLSALVRPWLGAAGQAAFYRQIAQAEQKYTDEIQSSYPDIRCPVSILWGEHDTWIPVEVGRKLCASIPKASFAVVPGAGHLAPLEVPGFVNAEALRLFLP